MRESFRLSEIPANLRRFFEPVKGEGGVGVHNFHPT
jgi:hypothetical protein